MKYIELNAFLKINNIARSGGDAKHFIRGENVKVNGIIETRNKKKLVAGDVVEIKDQKFIVEEEVCIKEKID